MKVLILLSLILTGTFTSNFSIAAEPYHVEQADYVEQPWRWKALEDLDLLNVNCMSESPAGDIWFGNVGSIARFNSEGLKVFEFDDELLLQVQDKRSTPLCQDIVVLNNGTPTCIVLGNLVVRNKGQWKVIYQRNHLKGGAKKILASKDNSLWLLTHHALLKFDRDLKNQTLCYKTSQDSTLITFCKDQNDTIWVIKSFDSPTLIKIPTFEGLPLAENQWSHYPLPVAEASVSAKLAITSEQKLIYVDRLDDVHVQQFDPQKESWSIPFDTGLRRHHALHIDQSGDIWLGGQESIYNSSSGNGQLYIDENWIPQTIIEELLKDRKERLWVRDRHNRINTVDLSNQKWSTTQNLHFHCMDSSGIRWFTNIQGEIISEAKGSYTRHQINSPAKVRFDHLYQSTHGLIWALGRAQNKAQLFIYRQKKWQHVQGIDLPSFAEGAFFESKDGSVWLGANTKSSSNNEAGLLQWKVNADLELVLTKHAKELVPKIYQCAQTDDGLIWIAGFALYCYHPAQDSLQLIKDLPFRKVNALTISSDGALWLAQTGLGLFRYHQGEWKNFSIKDGLPSNTIAELLALDNGHLLAASKKGISRYDGKNWVSPVYPENVYLVNGGGSMRKNTKGSIWINITEKEMPNSEKLGKRAFFTHQIKPNTQAPDTKIEFYSSQIAYQSGGLISWSGQDEWFDIEKDHLNYSWRLNKGTWSDFSPKKEQTFYDLKEGPHLFEVRARDRNFNIDATPASITFTVLGPIWKQPWFIALCSFFIVTIVVLITAMVKARERHLLLQQHEKEKHWAELDQIKTVFFSNITHELRTPLTVVLSRLESLLNNEKDEHKKGLMSVMLRNVNRISILISQLLDFKKIEEHNIRLEPSEGDIGLFIKDVVDRSKAYAEDHQCQLSCQGEAYGWFDPDKLDKILTNLISNAIKYSPEGGRINITFGQDLIHQQVCLKLQIEDQGCGIKPDQLQHIFERFYRVSDTSKTPGVGIGLNLTKELVDLWGGNITAESPIHTNTQQPGTRITLSLPIENVTQPKTSILSPDETITNEDKRAKHLLIVEDDAEIRSALHDELIGQYQISQSENGRLGMEKARDIMPDLIISDLMMPDMDGLQLCQNLKSDQLTSHIPIIMLTAKASLDSELEGLEKGADDYITKPFHITHVKQRIENILQNYERLRDKFSRHYMLPDQPLPEDTVDKEFFEKVFAILEQEVKDIHFDAEELARKLHMSLSTLRRKLKAITEDTPAKLIRDMRLKMGAALLIKSNLNVTQIALEVGFTESNHFARLFKGFYHKTPTQYRAEHSNGKIQTTDSDHT
jgi:signal transduction histidine kinase/CheY-like chemotaxis protein/ligand-binding sensor domain-containing protein